MLRILYRLPSTKKNQSNARGGLGPMTIVAGDRVRGPRAAIIKDELDERIPLAEFETLECVWTIFEVEE